MQIHVLGPLWLHHDGRPVTPTAPRSRSVLALLLLNAGRSVAVSALSQELWGDSPPAGAQATIQTSVGQLRRLFGRALGMPSAEVARRVLVTTPGGYLFRNDGDEFDLRTYEEVATAGRDALASGENGVAADMLMTARKLWRGPVLADVTHGCLLEPLVGRLEQARLATTEQSIEARLRMGRHQEVLSELAGLLDEHRLQENLYAQLMVALHRNGRREEALRVFGDLCGALADELGREPSQRLHRIQQAVLADDPALETTHRRDGPTQVPDLIAMQLMPDLTLA